MATPSKENNNQKNKKACLPSHIEGWSGKFYVSRSLNKEQVLVSPIIGGSPDNNMAIQIGTRKNPIKLRNIFYKPFQKTENGSRMIPFSFYGNNDTYRPFFESVDDALLPILEEYFRPEIFKREYAKVTDKIKKLWETKNKPRLKKENPKLDATALKRLLEEEAVKYMEGEGATLANQEWEDKRMGEYEPLITEKTYTNKNSNEEETSTSVKLMVSFDFQGADEVKEKGTDGNEGDKKEGDKKEVFKRGPHTTFSKYNEDGTIEPITYFDLPIFDASLKQTKSIPAIISIQLNSLRYRDKYLCARFFIHEFIMLDVEERSEIAAGIDLGDVEEYEGSINVNVTKKVEEKVNDRPEENKEVVMEEYTTQADKKRSFSDIDSETTGQGDKKTRLINDEDLASLNDVHALDTNEVSFSGLDLE